MAAKKFTVKENSIYLGNVKKAEIDPEKKIIKDLYNGGGEIVAEILQFMKTTKEFGWESAELSDREIREAKDIWQIVPEAPRPSPNTLGDKHPDIYDFIEENYPNIFKIRYERFGRYDKDLAGMGVNLAPYRDKVGNGISEDSMKRLKGSYNEKRAAYEKWLEENPA